MKKIVYVFAALALMLIPAACSAPAAEDITTPSQTIAATPAPLSETEMIAAASVDELGVMIGQYKAEENYEMVYAAALRLTELDPSEADAYVIAADALLKMSGADVDEINRLLALGTEKAEDTQPLTAWAEQNQPAFSITIPFSPDYTSAGEINTSGVTTGNQTNAAKYNGNWRGGLLTWQGNWVYLSRPDEDFAICKMRTDGSEYQRVGDACGSSLNVIGDWMYFINTADGDKPYKMRTDGSMMSKLTDDCCAFLSVSGDWMYYDNGSDSGCLYKTRLDGSESVKLSSGTAIFTCVADGWVYYCEKSMDGGLSRVSVEGGEPQHVASGFIVNYCVVGEWLYYINANDPYGIRRVHTDGISDEEMFRSDFPITTFNVANDTLFIAFGAGYEEDGFHISQEIVTLDLATLTKRDHVEGADTEPLCIGPEGQLYFLKFSDGLAWYTMDESGAVNKIG